MVRHGDIAKEYTMCDAQRNGSVANAYNNNTAPCKCTYALTFARKHSHCARPQRLCQRFGYFMQSMLFSHLSVGFAIEFIIYMNKHDSVDSEN